jgi:hypothetical protein
MLPPFSVGHELMSSSLAMSGPLDGADQRDILLDHLMVDLKYIPLERVPVPRPVRRVPYIVERCRGKAVLDLGCYDETALVKQGTLEWVHGEIARVARSVLGVDNSDKIPVEGLATGATSRIIRGDLANLASLVREIDVEVVVAGEIIEHLPNVIGFFAQLRRLFPGRALLATTPNATSLTNVLLGVAGRESSHPDHVQIYSFKTLSTVCRRVAFANWELVPYHVYYSEMALRAGPVARRLVSAAEAAVNAVEHLCPLLAGGLILDVKQM